MRDEVEFLIDNSNAGFASLGYVVEGHRFPFVADRSRIDLVNPAKNLHKR